MKLFCDLHIHSCLSPCGDALMTPNNIVGMAFIKQLDAIAVCDHNTARNLPAIKEVADMMGMVLLPGLELTTREEAHMLAYFETVNQAVAFSDAVYAHLPPIPNNPKFFGEQQLMNAQDEVIGKEERLLISALDLSFEECAQLIHQHGGLCVPAHINRGSNGCLNALGFLPAGVAYDALEDNEYILCFMDSDIAKLSSFIQSIGTTDYKWSVLCFREQVPFLRSYLGENAVIRSHRLDDVLEELENEGRNS